MALYYQPRIFKRFENVRAALTLRGPGTDAYANNMSFKVGDDEERVRANRARAAASLGFPPERLATQMQVHGCVVREVGDRYVPGESDALITIESGWLLGAGVADCIPVLIHDSGRGLVAAIHSGWRGTAQNIVGAAIGHMCAAHGAAPESFHVYVGAAASQCCYEVGEDVAARFDERYSRPLGAGKYLFDNKGAVLAQVLACGVPALEIELDPRCTICDPAFHSYRRDGAASGRMLAMIGMASRSS